MHNLTKKKDKNESKILSNLTWRKFISLVDLFAFENAQKPNSVAGSVAVFSCPVQSLLSIMSIDWNPSAIITATEPKQAKGESNLKLYELYTGCCTDSWFSWLKGRWHKSVLETSYFNLTERVIQNAVVTYCTERSGKLAWTGEKNRLGFSLQMTT